MENNLSIIAYEGIITLLLVSLLYASVKGKFHLSKPAFVLCTITLLLFLVVTLSQAVSTINFRIDILLAGILLPFLWFFMFAGLIVYGVIAIITKQTYVRFPMLLLPKKIHGADAIYFGILWILAGCMMFLLEYIVITLALCSDKGIACAYVQFGESLFTSLGKILQFLAKPLQGYIK